MSKLPHKFFESYLDNDLKELSRYLLNLENKIFSGQVPNISKEYADTISGIHNLGNKYNIFQFHNSSIHNLYGELKRLTQEACSYYGIDFYQQQYMIQGWFNTTGLDDPELEKDSHYHDHLNGYGAPTFHGYYCVSAEPSSTLYRINNDKENIFENINKNNRAILSETGHPHGIGPWKGSEPRITIAYDIAPLALMSGDEEQHWIPLL